MPSFLSKVFGRKKDDKDSSHSHNHLSDPELLDGKFESVSPSATKFPEVVNGKNVGSSAKEKEKDTGFTLFRSKSPASSDASGKPSNAPLLSLNLPGPKDESASRALGVVFEADHDSQLLLSETTIGNRRLNPLETLILVRACSQAIRARGLETLGIMHPHWYSSSPDVQKRLISLFIQSLDPKSPITTLSPTPSSLVSAFESEISSTRSPHDVAAVLRWGFRHLQLEGTSFGREDTWYKSFFDGERSSGYSADAFSKILGPLLPASHFELLTVTLEIFMSLAAHAEVNGISGSKLSKFLGLWLLTAQRTQENDQWFEFYTRWERTGRILEHLFLSRIRDEALGSRMPKRLVELVRSYPYSATSDMDLLPRLRFSTRQYDALFVRIETELPTTAKQPTHHPLRLISEALKAETTAESEEYVSLWETIRKAGANGDGGSPGSYSGLSRVFADETLRFFALIPVENDGKELASPTFSLHIQPTSTHRRSFSLSDKDTGIATSTTTTDATRHKLATSPSVDPSSAIGTDWATFSTSGFFEGELPLATTLLEKHKDMEVTSPKVATSRPLVPSLINGRKSLDASRTQAKVEQAKPEEVRVAPKTTQVSLIQMDEAFIDFWSDALLDSISSSWPAFVVCKLRTTLPDIEVSGKRLEWLVVEQTFKRPQPPTPVSPETSTTMASDSPRYRPASPKSDISFTSARKRFSFFTSGRSSTSSEKGSKRKTKAGKSPRVGEMGEVLAEEEENKEHDQSKAKANQNVVRVRIPSPKPKKSTDAPRKSSDVAKKSHESEVKATGLVASAAAIAGAGAVTTSPDTPKPDAPISESPPTNGTAPENQTAPIPAIVENGPPLEPPVIAQEPASFMPTVEDVASTAIPSLQPHEPARSPLGAADPYSPPSTDFVQVNTEPQRLVNDATKVVPVAAEPEVTTEETTPELDPLVSSPPAGPPEPSETVESLNQTISEPELSPDVSLGAAVLIQNPEVHVADAAEPTDKPELPSAPVVDDKPIPTLSASDDVTIIPPKVGNNGLAPESVATEEEPSGPAIQSPGTSGAFAEEPRESSDAINVDSGAEASLPSVLEDATVPTSAALEAEAVVSDTEDAPMTNTLHAGSPPAERLSEAVNSEEPEPAEPVSVTPTEVEPLIQEVSTKEPVPESEVTNPTTAHDQTTENVTMPSPPIETEVDETTPTVPVPEDPESVAEKKHTTEDSITIEANAVAKESPSPLETAPESIKPTRNEVHPGEEINTLTPSIEPQSEPAPPELETEPSVSAEESPAPQDAPQIDVEPPSSKPDAEFTEPATSTVQEIDAIPPIPEPEAEEKTAVVAEAENKAPVSADEAEAQLNDGELEVAAQESTQSLEPETEVIEAVGHSEPLNAPEEDDADKGVTLHPVPIIEVEPSISTTEAAPVTTDEDTSPIAHTTEEEITPTGKPVQNGVAEAEEPSTLESVVLAGSTPGPQTILDSVIDPEVAPSSSTDDAAQTESDPAQEPVDAADGTDGHLNIPLPDSQAVDVDDAQQLPPHNDVTPVLETLLATVEETEGQTTDGTSTQLDPSIPSVHHDDSISTPPPS